MSMQLTVEHALKLANSGDKAAARKNIRAILKTDKENVRAWAALAGFALTRQEAVTALENVLRLQPNHPWATRQLQRLTAAPAEREPALKDQRAVVDLPEQGFAQPLLNRLDDILPDRDARVWRWMWLIVIGWLAGAFLLANYLLRGVRPFELQFYIAQPVLWSLLGMLGLLGWRYGLEERPRPTRTLLISAFIIGLFQVSTFVIAGLLSSFGRSPYSHRLLPTLGNLLYAGTFLIGIEMSRAYLVKRFSRRSAMLGLTFTLLLFSFLSIPPRRFALLSGDDASVIMFMGEVILPVISENLLATFLALVGGPFAALAYRSGMVAFHWLSPILPTPDWIVTTFLGTIVPLLGFVVIQRSFAIDPNENAETHGDRRRRSLNWSMAIIAVVALIWFNNGFFGIHPTLVLGSSMLPTLEPGDVVIVTPVELENVEVGDILVYRDEKTNGLTVIHRLISIDDSSGQIELITRGDNMPHNDRPVPEAALHGKVSLVVPKIGWLAIAVKEGFQWALGLGTAG